VVSNPDGQCAFMRKLLLFLALMSLVASAPGAFACQPTCDLEGNCMIVFDESNGGVCLDYNVWEGKCRGGYVSTGVGMPPVCPGSGDNQS
jgi:hypothetical protein